MKLDITHGPGGHAVEIGDVYLLLREHSLVFGVQTKDHRRARAEVWNCRYTTGRAIAFYADFDLTADVWTRVTLRPETPEECALLHPGLWCHARTDLWDESAVICVMTRESDRDKDVSLFRLSTESDT